MNYKTYYGLQEAKHCITELIPKEEQGRYHKEIFDAIDSATKILFPETLTPKPNDEAQDDSARA